jgi:PAS domain S-box-containing protein
MRTLFENSMVGILLAAPGGRVFAANPAACRLFGRTEEDIRRIGRSGLMDSRDPRVNAVLRARTEKGYAMGEMTLVRGDGTRFPAQVASARFETEEGPRTSLVIQDLSERKLAEERIRDFSRRLLSVREEDKRRLSTVLHHDVGSFTVGVMAQLYAAEDGLRAGKSKEALASLKECRRVFSESVKRLKSLAVELRPPDLDLLGLSAALRQHFLQLSRETSLRIHFSDATHGAAITPEVQTVLFRAAQECLNNVVQHAQAASARVRLTALKQGIRLSLADDGKGFDPGEVVHRPGAHLGLRALQEMAATLGGMLDIASKPGRGTKVTVTIPGRGKGEAGTGQ